jgi:coproporphyrinogen III oxidase
LSEQINAPGKDEIASFFQQLQDSICNDLEIADGSGRFHEDVWERPGGGGGRSRILTNGKIIEKGGVNFSAVFGKPEGHILKSSTNDQVEFFATGVSIVLHPANPHVPIIHMNVRYFEMTDGTWWFGGGIDLTPHYIVEEDARTFHHVLKAVCDRFNPDFYLEFKNWADEYFFIPHRKETRGVGGIFFDRLNDARYGTKRSIFDFVKAVGESFAPIYTQLMLKNHPIPFTENHRRWQLLRRGRYVEFNLVYDKGTKFGLETNGRIESILMSLPALAAWEYNFLPNPGSEESKTLSLLVKDKNWL